MRHVVLEAEYGKTELGMARHLPPDCTLVKATRAIPARSTQMSNRICPLDG